MPEKETKTISPSKATAAKTIFEAFKIGNLKVVNSSAAAKYKIQHEKNFCSYFIYHNLFPLIYTATSVDVFVTNSN